MNNVIELEDVKLWIGELFLENKLMKKEINRLKMELEKIKTELLESSSVLRKEKGEAD